MAPKQNPDNPCPADILAQIRAVKVEYLDFDGNLQTGFIEVNKMVADDVKAFFEETAKQGFPIEKVVRSSDAPYFWDDQKLMADNATSGFNYRPVIGSDHISQHGLGLALDINTRLNPCIRSKDGKRITVPQYATWNPELPGTLSAEHPLVRYMIRKGWYWGGDWTLERDGLIDYQHFVKPRDGSSDIPPP